jgi:hypothetical protein
MGPFEDPMVQNLALDLVYPYPEAIWKERLVKILGP